MLIIRNARIHDGLGGVREADLAVENGKIAAISSQISDSGAAVLDAQGGELFPGFIDSQNIWGTVGPGWTEDDNHEGSNPLTPEMNIIYGFDHDGMNFQKVYRFGVTAACIGPSSKNLISGQAAVFKTFGRSPYDMLVKESACLLASITKSVKRAYKKREIAPMTRMGMFSMLKEAFQKARTYDAEKEGYNARSLTLKRVLAGELPLFINCSGQAQIDFVFQLMKEYPEIRFALTGAFGLDESREAVRRGEVPVILGDQTESYFPDNRQTKAAEIVAMMESEPENSPLIAISCCGDGLTSGKESLLWNALYWRRRGLSSEKTLAAITSVPARILGVEDRIGSIEEGKDADFSIWRGNPLDHYTARLLHVFISGQEISPAEGGNSCW